MLCGLFGQWIQKTGIRKGNVRNGKLLRTSVQRHVRLLGVCQRSVNPLPPPQSTAPLLQRNTSERFSPISRPRSTSRVAISPLTSPGQAGAFLHCLGNSSRSLLFYLIGCYKTVREMPAQEASHVVKVRLGAEHAVSVTAKLHRPTAPFAKQRVPQL